MAKKAGSKRASKKKRKSQSPEKTQSGAGLDKLSAQLRKWTELFAGHPDRSTDPPKAGIEASWWAGYRGGSPEEPVPTDAKKRAHLSQQAAKCRKHPVVSAYLAKLDHDASAAFFGTPEGQRALENAGRAELGRVDVADLQARNLELMMAVVHGDPEAIVKWSADGIEVTDSSELTELQRKTIRRIKHDEVDLPKGGVKRTTTVEFEPRLGWMKELVGRLGVPVVRVEHSGPGGGAIPHSHEGGVEVGMDDDLLDFIAENVLGGVPASKVDDGTVPLVEVVAAIKAWMQDDEAEVGRAFELFEPAQWPETRARYLIEDE